MRLAICVIFLLTLFGINAGEYQKILSVESTGLDKAEADMSLLLEADGPTDKALGLAIEDHLDGELKQFNMKKLKKGVVLKKQSGYTILSLQSDNFTPKKGGDFKLWYAVDALKKSKKSIPLSIKYSASRYRWFVQHKGKEVKNLNFHVNRRHVKLLGNRAVGIKRVEVK